MLITLFALEVSFHAWPVAYKPDTSCLEFPISFLMFQYEVHMYHEKALIIYSSVLLVYLHDIFLWIMYVPQVVHVTRIQSNIAIKIKPLYYVYQLHFHGCFKLDSWFAMRYISLFHLQSFAKFRLFVLFVDLLNIFFACYNLG